MSVEWAVVAYDVVLRVYRDEAAARREWARFPDVRTLLRREVTPWAPVHQVEVAQPQRGC